MSDAVSAPTGPIAGEVVETCSATAASCACSKKPGHVAGGDLVHECDPSVCTGAWTGDYGAPAGGWAPVRFPVAVRS